MTRKSLAVSVPLLAAVVCAFSASGAFAQAADDGVFAPYPSRIRVGVRGQEVVVSWVDSPDVSSGYSVFRNAEFPSSDNFAAASLLGRSESGEKGFVYVPGDSAPYYYFVLADLPPAEAKDGETVYKVFIPLRNVAMEPIAVKATAPDAPAVPAPAPTSQPSAQATAPTAPAITPSTSVAPQEGAAKAVPTLSGILVRADQDAIVVSIDAVEGSGRLIVYRSTLPLNSSASLLDAALAAIVNEGSGPYRDYPVPGVEYYYGIVPERDLAGGSVSLIPGLNASSKPVSIQAGTYRVGLPSMPSTSRSMPLPYLVLTRGFEDAKPVGIEDPTPLPKPLSPETAKAVAELETALVSSASAPRPALTIFPEDLHSGGGGEAYTLRTIVTGYLTKGDYAEAARQLTLFLSLPRASDNASKARFYRGQAYAMSGSYREAFFDLLQTQASFYIETSAWIDFILDELHRGRG